MKPQQPRHEAGEADRLRDRQPESLGLNAPDERLAGPMERLKELVWGSSLDRGGALGDDAISGRLGRLWDALAPAISDGLSDIRKHVIEEGWFGKETSPREIALTSHGASPALAESAPIGFKELMQAQKAMLPPDQLDRNHETPERPHDAGVDR